jgi:esterase/lipase superfamily enzyme
VGTRQPFGTPGLFLLAVLLAVVMCDAAGAQSRWPPWQSYGEAERTAHAKQKRQATPKQGEIDALNKRVEQLRRAGKTAEAIAAAKSAVSLTEKIYGPNHPATAAALTRLADLLIEQKRYAEAEPLLKRALAIHEKSMGQNRPEGAQALDNLAKLYAKEGKKADAKQLEERAVALRGGPAPSGGKEEMREGDGAMKEAKSKADTEAKAAHEQAEAARQKAEQEKARAQAEAERAKAMADAKHAAEAREDKRKAEASERSKVEEKKSAEEKDAAEVSDALKSRPLTRSLHRAAPPADGSGSGEAAAPKPAPEPDMMARRSGGGAPQTMEPLADKPAAPPPVAASRAPSQPPPPAAAPEGGLLAQQEKWDVVPVFFGTDRAEEPNPKRLSYGSDRGHHLELGRAFVTVPKLHEVPQIERPWALRIPYFNVTVYEQAEDPNKHFTMQEIKKLSKEGFLDLVRKRLAGSQRFKDQALVFVHGYNTSFDNAVYRTAQIAYDLKFDGAPFLYSWPSGGAVASYTYDRESAGASKPYMRQFLQMVCKETGAKAVSIIAHSMGNQPLLDVLKDMKSAAPEGVVISQIILAAPDVDADTFSDLAAAINGLAKGITLYAASNDRALLVSRNFWGHYRAGDVPANGPLVLPGIDTIDVTAASTDAFAINHSGYAQNNDLLKDIGELIETGRRPPEDRHMKPDRIPTDHGAYWRYAAHPSSP